METTALEKRYPPYVSGVTVHVGGMESDRLSLFIHSPPTSSHPATAGNAGNLRLVNDFVEYLAELGDSSLRRL
jgi:hypothetical protein